MIMKLLIIEDEESLLQSIVDYLQKEISIIETASNFIDGLSKISAYDYDCILLDINLPGGTGLKLLEELKANKKADGVIIISARDSLEDRLQGLNLGADDYLIKPFHLSELNARVKAIIRRKKFDASNVLEFKNVRVDIDKHKVYIDQQLLNLTKKEYDLLLHLLANKNRVISKNSLVQHLWGEYSDTTDSFDFIFSHIKNLKKKIKNANGLVDIKSIYGVGYQLVEA